ncbi:MAG: hypothetical protein ACK4E0_18545 [Chitinophagaceae bacterium]
MEVLVGLISLLIGYLFYRLLKPNKADSKIGTLQQHRDSILNAAKKELYDYAKSTGKIGKMYCMDIEEGGHYLAEFNDEDMRIIDGLISKNILFLPNSDALKMVTIRKAIVEGAFPHEFIIGDTLEKIIPYLRLEIDKLPISPDKHYTYSKGRSY